MSKREEEKRRKNITGLLLLLLLTITMLVTTTYAWFTANKTVTISSLDVHVETSSGIQISTNAVDWKTIITDTDIKTGAYSGNFNQLPSTLTAVSTIGAVDSASQMGRMRMFAGSVEANETTGNFELTTEEITTETAGETGSYIAFDIFLKVDTTSQVYFGSGTGVTAKQGTSEKGLSNAARIAFVREGYGTATAAPSSITSQHNPQLQMILEPNYDTHTAFGIQQGQQYYTTYSNVNSLSAGSGNSKVSYDGVKANISTGLLLNTTNATNNTNYFQTVTTRELPTTYSNGSYAGANTQYVTLDAGVTKVRVYMWIEGQDIDCENNASGSDLTFNVTLTLNATSVANP